MNIQLVSTMRNEAKNLPFFLETLAELRTELCIDLHAVIVDNGSTDNTDEVIRALPELSYVKFLRNPDGATYAEGLEKAIAKVSTPYVFVVPSDLQFDTKDLIKMLKAFDAFRTNGQNTEGEVALFSFRRFRSDGFFQRFRGKVWRFVVTHSLRVDHRLDPASQLKIIPTPRHFQSINKNFIWDIEVLVWAINRIVDYRIIEVSFKPRIFGESSISNNPLKSVWTAVFGLIRLTHRSMKSNSAGRFHFRR